ncbi:MAG TPA: diguanylate cyclase [Macromonas sp.]|nr:diguanylate cyclase [Macromonas sp.]
MHKVSADAPNLAPLDFTELVDIPVYASVLEHFHRATGIANGVLDTQGRWLCQSGWTNPPPQHLAAPVSIEGQQVATLFMDLPPAQPHAQVQAQLSAMAGMAEMLATSGLARMRQQALAQNLNRADERRIELEDILAASPVAIGWSNATGRIEYINDRLTSMFGFTRADIPDLATWFAKAYPDADYRSNVITPWWASAKRILADGDLPQQLESDITCKNGRVLHATMRVSRVGNRHLVIFSDETERWENLQRMRAHDAMLEMVARGTQLEDILDTIARQVEQEDPTALCSILLLDDDQRHMRTASSPSLPPSYIAAIDGFEIGPTVGACGSAAYLGKRVVVEDIATHPNWQDYLDLALGANLRACWSEPIVSSTRQILGTFAIYHTRVCGPTEKDIERIGFAANLCAVAVEHRRALTVLEQRAYSDPLTGLANRRAFIEHATGELARTVRNGGTLSVLMMDIDHFKWVNDTYGHAAGDRVLRALTAVCETTVRTGDLIGRIGGEEFAILLPDTAEPQAMEIAERLRLALAATATELPDGPRICVTASLGVATLGDTGSQFEALLSQADQALYRAKREGRNCICRFDPVAH